MKFPIPNPINHPKIVNLPPPPTTNHKINPLNNKN